MNDNTYCTTKEDLGAKILEENTRRWEAYGINGTAYKQNRPTLTAAVEKYQNFRFSADGFDGGVNDPPEFKKYHKQCKRAKVARAALGPVESVAPEEVSQAIDVPDPGAASKELGWFW